MLIVDGSTEAPPLSFDQVHEGDTPSVRDAHALLREEMEFGDIEDLDSFVQSVSSAADSHVVPFLLRVRDRHATQGVVLAAYLTELNMGMMLYSAVRKSLRERGVYSQMRAFAIQHLNWQAGQLNGCRASVPGLPGQIGFLMSEWDDSRPYFRRFLARWGSYVAPCDYRQPPVQGLVARPFRLVFQSIGRQAPPSPEELAEIVLEIYGHIYRIPDAARSPYYRQAVDTMLPAATGDSYVAPGRRR